MDTALACPERNASARWDFADGRAVTVRAVQPGDLQLASEFVARGLTQQSRYQRFQTGLSALPPGMAAYLTDIDFRQHVALLAVAEHGGRAQQVGEARYVCDGDLPDQAEFALAVADDWQGKGLGHALLERLCEAARAAGYEALYGYILEANRDMLELAAHLGFVEQARSGSEVTVVRQLR